MCSENKQGETSMFNYRNNQLQVRRKCICPDTFPFQHCILCWPELQVWEEDFMSFLPTLETILLGGSTVQVRLLISWLMNHWLYTFTLSKLFFLSCSEPVMCAKHQDSRGELEENNHADFICSFENWTNLTYIFTCMFPRSCFYYNPC